MTLEDLVETADALVRKLAPKQTKYKVTERPDARTIRFYVTQGLLPKPVSYEGGRARYAGAHLLRLLLIKRLQAEHHTLSRIARVLEKLDDQQVLALLKGEEAALETGDLAGMAGMAAKPVAPGVALAAAPFAPAAGAGRSQRLTLAPGGALEVPAEVMADAGARRKLAESLEALAALLKQTTQATEDEGELA